MCINITTWFKYVFTFSWYQGQHFTGDQLISMNEFLPNDDEKNALVQYMSTHGGDDSRLG